jgi:hypothetical protein
LKVPPQGGFFTLFGASISELKIVGKRAAEAESIIWKELEKKRKKCPLRKLEFKENDKTFRDKVIHLSSGREKVFCGHEM